MTKETVKYLLLRGVGIRLRAYRGTTAWMMECEKETDVCKKCPLHLSGETCIINSPEENTAEEIVILETLIENPALLYCVLNKLPTENHELQK